MASRVPDPLPIRVSDALGALPTDDLLGGGTCWLCNVGHAKLRAGEDGEHVAGLDCTNPDCGKDPWKQQDRLLQWALRARIPIGIGGGRQRYVGDVLDAAAADRGELVTDDDLYENATSTSPREGQSASEHAAWKIALRRNNGKYRREVADRLVRRLAHEDADLLHAAEKSAMLARCGPIIGSLAEILALPPAPRYRIDSLLPWNGSTLVVAQRKTGKTTFTLNLAKSLIDGSPFLGRFEVQPLTGRIAILNYEVSAQQLATWACETEVNRDGLVLVNLRGVSNPLAVESERLRLAQNLREREVEAVCIDPFGRAFTGNSQNDAGEVQTFLGMLDRFVREDVGAKDLILSAHAGWGAERSRGSSGLEDWADSIITLVRGKEGSEQAEERYLKAMGRDVDVAEDRLDYDPTSRRLSLTGKGSRHDHKGESIEAAVAAIVRASPGCNGSQVETALRDQHIPFSKGEERKALRRLVERGDLTCEPRGSAKHYFPNSSTDGQTDDSRGTSPSIEGGGEVPQGLYRVP